MKKNSIFVMAILLTTCIICSAIELTTYKAEIVKKIIAPELIYGPGVLPHGPQAFTISPDGLIYIADFLARRIVIFDLELNKLREIDMQKYWTYVLDVKQMKLNNTGDIIILSSSECIRLDENENKLPGGSRAFFS